MPNARRALLLVNRRARSGPDRGREAADRLRARGLELVEEWPDRPAAFPRLINRHREAVDLVVVGGGDGTLGAAAEGLLAADLPLGILPLGTANNVARTLGIPAELDAACEIVAAGRERRIDLGRVNGRHFLTTASLGLSVEITRRLSHDAKRRLGPLAYVVTAARTLGEVRPFRAEITWPGGAVRSRTVQIVVGNGRYYGTALPVAEDAEIVDRRLDLYSMEIRRWWEALLLLPALRRGSHGERPEVRTLRAPWFEIRTYPPQRIGIDGELGPTTPARFDVLPSALRVICPP
ncbi:MAG TPA: lipid kinase [Gemmatimonadales bacterium]|nr:lipid kinase [Gemmatimonadales bacterium]